MRIALVIENFDPEAGGAERSTAQIAEELVRRGHAVTVVAGAVAKEPPRIEGVEVEYLARWKSASLLRLLVFVWWARRKLERGAFDVSLSMTTAVPATVLQPRSGTVRETLERNVAMRGDALGRWSKRVASKLNPKYAMQLLLERRTLQAPRLKKVAAVSDYVVEQLKRHYQVSGERVEVIANASVMPTAGAEEKQRWGEQVRAGLGIDVDATVYLFAAQNPRLKGLEPLLRATKRLIERGHKPVLLLVGRFYYGHLKQVNAAGLRQAVRFVRQTRRMHVLYGAADVTVLPTFYDPASKVVIESLMMGTPAISTSYNGASGLIAPPSGELRGRVIADPADDVALAETMAELADEAERQRCRAAMATMGEPMSMREHVDRLERLLASAGWGEGEGEKGAGEEPEPAVEVKSR